MWCPECHKAFSWKTGIVDTGVVHNPHFYQHQQQLAAAANANGTADANAIANGAQNANANGANTNALARQCVEGNNGNLCAWYTFNQLIIGKLYENLNIPADNEFVKQNNIQSTKEIRDLLTELHRSLTHIINVTAQELRTKVRTLSDHEEMRVKYILKRCDKDELANHIYRCDTLRQKSTETLHVLELFSVVGTEMFQRLITSPYRNIQFLALVLDQFSQLDKLRVYCNKQLATVSATYNQSVPQIKPTYETHRIKFSIRSQKALEKQ